MSALPRLNRGYAYREQVQQRAQGTSVLAHLTGRYSHSSPTEWKERIEAGEVWLDGQLAQPHSTLKAGQVLIWQRPPWLEEAAPRRYQVVHADAALLAVVKPSGLPTLPGGGFLENTLLSAVQDDYPEASPLHRLGRGTSGLVLFARTAQAAAALSSAWREHTVHKRYRALAAGTAPQTEYDLSAAIGPVAHPRLGTVHAASASGKPSHSLARVLERRTDATLFQVDISTGRPHQIRIHLASAGFPLLNDPLYGVGGTPLATLPGLPGDGGYWLHAAELRFVHPLSGEELHLCATPPPDLQTAEERAG
ncbi:RluA family pseudouridine synthase [Deinococcus sp. KNUC1210]|uniref:RluA family pseudouridine synthase n=1 Tax=Deinococcus sp. KNUC1210 TaxID=2917691 RepID=UPI001EEF91D0|nr:RluA family pseudouridine synthase [Deinococcus sp. KNUC1210]ULH16207.1 RluA family pseudouridine synthase [Deinococcus sp. KNUC1210]